MTKEFVISYNSCGGEEEQFLAWMQANYPEINSSIEQVIEGGYFVDGIEADENFWDQYGKS